MRQLLGCETRSKYGSRLWREVSETMNSVRLTLLRAATCGFLVAFGLLARTGFGAEIELAIAPSQAIADPFARLRNINYSPQDDYWQRVGQALSKLETIEGAAYDSRYGVLTLHGKPAAGEGPYDLDDLMTALRAAYFEHEALGMTIDPNPKDPHGPEMIVRYFGGCEDTALGWVMFECDRLLKSLSQGQDSISGAKLDPDVPDFLNMLEIGLLSGDREASRWNRFWLAFDLEKGLNWRKEPKQSNKTQPVVYATQTRDGAAISFLRCRVFLRTEMMRLQGGKMVPIAGGADKGAERFAIHFTCHFDEFTQRFPEFERLEALTRLVVLAEWIEMSAIPMDVDYFRDYRQRVQVRTPTVTPSSTASLQRVQKTKRGSTTTLMQGFGGVDFNPRTFYASDVDGVAAEHQQFSRNELREHPAEITWTTLLNDKPTRVVVLPTRKTQLKRRANRSSVGTMFRRSNEKETSAADRIPSSEIARDERSESAPVERISLENLDRFRKRIRGPPESRHDAPVLHDDRYITLSERGEPFPPEKVELKRKEVEPGNRIRGPPDGRVPPSDAADAKGFEAKSERGEIAGREAASLKIDDAKNKMQRPRAPPEFSALEERAEILGREAAPLADDSKFVWGMPLFFTASGETTFSLPKLVSYQSPHGIQTTEIEGVPDSSMEIPDQIGLASETGDISLLFGKPRIDQKRIVFFFPPRIGNAYELVGYYPRTRSLEFRDGLQIRFDQQGNPSEARLPDGTSLRFRYAPHENAAAWPRPIACIVDAPNDRAESGEYRMVRRVVTPQRRN